MYPYTHTCTLGGSATLLQLASNSQKTGKLPTDNIYLLAWLITAENNPEYPWYYLLGASSAAG